MTKEEFAEFRRVKSTIVDLFEREHGTHAMLDIVATTLESSEIELNETALASIAVAVFKAGQKSGKEELKKQIAGL